MVPERFLYRNCGLLTPNNLIAKYISPVLKRPTIIKKCNEEPFRFYQMLHDWLGFSDDGNANYCQLPKVS